MHRYPEVSVKTEQTSKISTQLPAAHETHLSVFIFQLLIIRLIRFKNKTFQAARCEDERRARRQTCCVTLLQAHNKIQLCCEFKLSVEIIKYI